MDKKNKLDFLDKIANMFEGVIAFILLFIIGIFIIDLICEIFGAKIPFFNLDFYKILSSALTLVIGIEFVRMLCKHTPETVIDILLFAIARQTILYHEGILHMAAGVAAIAGLFAVRKFLIGSIKDKNGNL